MPDLPPARISKDIFLGPTGLAWDVQVPTQETEVPVSNASPHGPPWLPGWSTVEGAPGPVVGAGHLVLDHQSRRPEGCFCLVTAAGSLCTPEKGGWASEVSPDAQSTPSPTPGAKVPFEHRLFLPGWMGKHHEAVYPLHPTGMLSLAPSG